MNPETHVETLVIYIGNAEHLDRVFEALDATPQYALDQAPARHRRAGKTVLLAASFEGPGKGRNIYLIVGALRDVVLEENIVKFANVPHKRFAIPVIVSDSSGAANAHLTGKPVFWSPSQTYWLSEDVAERIVGEAERTSHPWSAALAT